MKRSEAVKIYADNIKAFKLFLKDVDWSEEKRDQELAFILLGVAEETLGMVPPEIKEESYQLASNGEMIYDVRRWDKE